MSLLSKWFGSQGAEGESEAEEGRNRQLPSSMVAEIFGEVDVRPRGSENEILFTILMEPAEEQYQTGVAIDASHSMRRAFGKALVIKEPPQDLLKSYLKKGWLKIQKHGGKDRTLLSPEAEQDLVDKGWGEWSKNEVQATARDFVSYLASTLGGKYGTSVIYWACGDGSQLEEIGELVTEQAAVTKFDGPKEHSFGKKTRLLPALRHFVERSPSAPRAMYLFITDGEIHDLEEVMAYTKTLCRDIARGARNPVKCVLIGFGPEVDETQMEELDDLETGTDVDLWDHKIAEEMRSLKQIFSEVVSEHQIVAASATIYDSEGRVAKAFTDGLPARVVFSMPASSEWFELEVSGEKIRQSIRVE